MGPLSKHERQKILKYRFVPITTIVGIRFKKDELTDQNPFSNKEDKNETPTTSRVDYLIVIFIISKSSTDIFR